LGLGPRSDPTNQNLLKINMLLPIMDKFVDNLFVCLREHGFQARIVSVFHLHQLQKEIENLQSHGLVDSHFYQDRLVRFNFQIPKDLPKAQSLIVAAVPRPQTRAIFTWSGRRHSLILPPT
jgi:epoxyqueuosine reductase